MFPTEYTRENEMLNTLITSARLTGWNVTHKNGESYDNWYEFCKENNFFDLYLKIHNNMIVYISFDSNIYSRRETSVRFIELMKEVIMECI
ncbi:hypothetical protein D3C85_1324840 [compost metagenome]